MEATHDFKIGDKVKGDFISDGEVWKISDYGVHVRRKSTESEKKMCGNAGEYTYQVFHFKPTHHKQTSVEKLKHYTT
jgi:hypothetical protein